MIKAGKKIISYILIIVLLFPAVTSRLSVNVSAEETTGTEYPTDDTLADNYGISLLSDDGSSTQWISFDDEMSYQELTNGHIFKCVIDTKKYNYIGDMDICKEELLNILLDYFAKTLWAIDDMSNGSIFDSSMDNDHTKKKFLDFLDWHCGFHPDMRMTYCYEDYIMGAHYPRLTAESEDNVFENIGNYWLSKLTGIENQTDYTVYDELVVYFAIPVADRVYICQNFYNYNARKGNYDEYELNTFMINVMTSISSELSDATSFISSILTDVQVGFDALISGIEKLDIDIVNAIVSAENDIVEAIENISIEVGDVVIDFTDTNQLLTGISSQLSKLISIDNHLNNISNYMKNWSSSIGYLSNLSYIDSKLQSVMQYVGSISSMMQNGILPMFSQALTYLDTIANSLYVTATSGDDVISIPIIAVLSEKIDNVVDAITNINVNVNIDVNTHTPSGDEDEDASLWDIVSAVMYLILIVGGILEVMLLMLEYVVLMFQIPATPALFNSYVLQGWEHANSIKIPDTSIGILDFLRGLVYLTIIFGVVGLIRREINRGSFGSIRKH